MKLSKIIERAINNELKDCRKWYGRFLKEEQKTKVTTLSEVENAMNDIEPQDDFENIIFSSGFVMGMRQAIQIVQAHETKENI